MPQCLGPSSVSLKVRGGPWTPPPCCFVSLICVRCQFLCTGNAVCSVCWALQVSPLSGSFVAFPFSPLFLSVFLCTVIVFVLSLRCWGPQIFLGFGFARCSFWPPHLAQLHHLAHVVNQDPFPHPHLLVPVLPPLGSPIFFSRVPFFLSFREKTG